MHFIPHTDAEIAEMLAAIGVTEIEALFEAIPADLRLRGDLNLSGPTAEDEVLRALSDEASRNATIRTTTSFLGAGAYDHFVPAAVRALVSRGEFLTSYTPYQPELSQGTLQAQFEFQTLVARLLGLDVANASMYDGATSLAEACLLARRHARRERVVVSRAVHPQYRAVLHTYLGPDSIVEVGYGPDGATDVRAVAEHVCPEVAAVVVQSPNFFGVVEDVAEAAAIAHSHDALLISTFTEPLAFGLCEPPGTLGADVAAGEGRSFGLPLSFGGPYVGLFAVRHPFVKVMPGRLVGRTVDSRGNPCYTLTLAAREQHIRRARAGSNICTNEGLCAVAVAIYLSLLGRTGLQRLALFNHVRSERLKAMLNDVSGLSFPFSGPTFNEFVVRLPAPVSPLVADLGALGLVPGYPLGRDYPDLAACLLVTVTERHTDSDFERLVTALSAHLTNLSGQIKSP